MLFHTGQAAHRGRTQFTQALRVHAPRVPVLLLSGYGGARLAQRASMAGVNRMLAKPVQRAPLAHALAELLQDARTRPTRCRRGPSRQRPLTLR